MLIEQFVRETIERHIAELDEQIADLMKGHALASTIEKLEFASSALIDLQHDLRLCDCPDEAYSQKAKG